MRYSLLLGKTLKEAPAGEEAVNAQLLIRAGYIDKLMSGSYTLLHLGKRVQQKIENIIREEMNEVDAQEILMPLLHPKEVWNETGRWESADEVMYKLSKGEREFVLSFTHEEIFLDLVRKHVRSYRDLPLAAYHFSTKFRSELRAKSGILRGREFIMKDLYSVHTNEEDFKKYYERVADSYMRIFERIGLDVVRTKAGGGVFTEGFTDEFQFVCERGEDTIYFSDAWEGAKNEEVMSDEDRNASGLTSKKSIEVGNIFPLGTVYSEKMGVYYIDENNEKKPLFFGSYGIGITRLIGVIAEVMHDERGLLWPKSVAPYQAHLVGLTEKADEVYEVLKAGGVEVLYDDRRDVTAGTKFTDADLIGIPVRLVVSERTGDKVEVKMRGDDSVEMIPVESIVKSVKSL